jgi:hypothetical protein
MIPTFETVIPKVNGRLKLTLIGGKSSSKVKYEVLVGELPRTPDGKAGPAELAGLRVGDQVMSIQDIPVAGEAQRGSEFFGRKCWLSVFVL